MISSAVVPVARQSKITLTGTRGSGDHGLAVHYRGSVEIISS